MADEEQRMGEPQMAMPAPAPAPVVAPSASGMFLKREMNGASFLSLEHVAHMVLVVVVAALVVSGINMALSMWMNSGVNAIDLMSSYLGTTLLSTHMQTATAVSTVAALIVFAPLLVILDRRTRAEWMKRHGYSGRVAYKVPVYTALGVLVAAKLVAVVMMLTVVLNSLVMIGVAGADIGDMYLTQFIPAFIAAVVFGAAALYMFKLAKGRDMGRQFSMLMALVSGALVLALLITAVSTAHSTKTTSPMPDYLKDTNTSRDLEDLFRY